MKFKKLISLGFIIVASMGAWAQQDPVYSQYLLNMMSINPAYAGSRDYLSLTGVYRNQWMNVEGAPKTYNLNGDILFDKKNVGLGAALTNDQIGIYSNNTLALNYAYKILFKNNGVLSLGLSGSISYQLANLSRVATTSQVVFDASDDEVFSGNVQAWLPNVGAGTFYSTSKFFVGFSVPKLLNNTLNKKITFSDKAIIYRQSRHSFLTAGYVFDLDKDYKLKPSFLVKHVEGAPIQADLNLQFWAFDAVSFGVSYRTNTSFVSMIQMQATPKLKIGYAYDYYFTKFSRGAAGAHEIVINYDFIKDREQVISPRYF